IVYWKEHSARVFRGERRPPELRGLGVNEINALIYRRWRREPPRAVVTWHREVHANVLRTLARMPAAAFARPGRSAFWPGDFDGHSAAHRVKDIEAALNGGRDAWDTADRGGPLAPSGAHGGNRLPLRSGGGRDCPPRAPPP